MASRPRPSLHDQAWSSRRAAPFLLVVALPWLTTCGSPPASDVVTSHPIQGGTNDTTHTFAVGIVIQMSGGTALCSGALLAPNLVATARHCVAAIPADGVVTCPDTKFGAVVSPSSIVVSTDSDLRGMAVKTTAVSKVIVPSGADQTSVCGNDLALLILSQNVSLPAYVTPVLNPPMTDHTAYSPTITAIGYGVSSATDMTGASAGTRRIRQNVALSCIPNDPTFSNCYPSRNFPMTAAEFASGNATCEGDSGSDAYEENNFDAGHWVGFGVLSRGASQGSTCLGGIYTRFDAWSSLIIDAATQAATAGGYDLPSWAMPGIVGDASVGPGDAATGAGGATVDASTDVPPRTDGSVPADAGSGGTGGAGAFTGRDAAVSSGGVTGAVDAAGSGGSNAPTDAGTASDGPADAVGFDNRPLTDLRPPDDGNGTPAPEADAGLNFDGGITDARLGGGMTDAALSDGNPGTDGSAKNPSETATVGSSLSGCSCATAGGGGSSPLTLIMLGLSLGLVGRRQRRPRR